MAKSTYSGDDVLRSIYDEDSEAVSIASKGSFLDHSGLITQALTSQRVVAANLDRKYILFENVSDTDMWINFGTDANLAQPSMLIKASGGSFTMETGFICTDQLNVICSVVSKGFICKEG
jgi:hypothetical protein